MAKILRTTLALTFFAGTTLAQDWSQWRGENRDAHAAGFKAPAIWPKGLAQKWTVIVGEGVASPAVVGDKVYVFSRQEGNEIVRCLNATDGKELWAERYESLGASGPAQGFSGPRSSPAVAGGKVVTLGVRGMLSSLDAVSGQKLWRKDDFRAYPNFHPSSSPLIIGGLVVAQLGGRTNGALVAYDAASGEQKWKWDGPSPSYSSPVLANVNGTMVIVAHTESKLVAVNAADGTLAWELNSAPAGGGGGQGGPGEPRGPGGPGGPSGPGGDGGGRRGGRGGGGGDYKAVTPVLDGQTLIVAGRGVKAVKLEMTGGKLVGTELWNNADKSVQFATPTLKDGLIFGLSGNELFCLKAKDGTTAWSAPFPGAAGGGPGGPSGGGAPQALLNLPRIARDQTVFGQATPAVPAAEGERPRRPSGPSGGGPGGSGGRGRGGGGYGTIVDVGPVLFALTPSAQLIVFEPNAKELKVLASYKVADSQTHAYPVVSGNRIFIKDKESLTLWTVD